jgi:hypothetical protein
MIEFEKRHAAIKKVYDFVVIESEGDGVDALSLLTSAIFKVADQHKEPQYVIEGIIKSFKLTLEFMEENKKKNEGRENG